MSFEIDKALVNAYHSNIQIKFQQKGSRLRKHVRVEDQSAEFDFYDRITQTEAVEVLNRHADTPLISTPHDRRRVGLRDFDWADLIDKKDKIRMLADPTSSYVTNAVYALGRSMDRVIVQAAFDTAYIGKTGATTVAFPSSQEVAVNYVEQGAATNSNLTIGKLRRVRYLMDKAEVTTEGEYDLVAVVDPSQIQSLLQKTEVTSSDYNTIRALVNGEIDTYMGFKFVKYNGLALSTNTRSTIFFEREGILLAVGMEITTDVGPRRDKRNSTQVYVCGSFGASRMWEEKVVRVLCDESV
jgi:hypothetical protein